MKKMNFFGKTLLGLMIGVFAFSSCDEVVNDVKSTAAMTNVDFEYDTVRTDVILPVANYSGKTFDELYQENKAAFEDLSNYEIDFELVVEADNTSENAGDAKFNDILQTFIFNNLESTPLEIKTQGFEIKKNSVEDIVTEGGFNLKTHREAGVYIFEQMVAGDDIDTKITNKFFYGILGKESSFDLTVNKMIPTRASDEMKKLLGDILASGLLDEKVEE